MNSNIDNGKYVSSRTRTDRALWQSLAVIIIKTFGRHRTHRTYRKYYKGHVACTWTERKHEIEDSKPGEIVDVWNMSAELFESYVNAEWVLRSFAIVRNCSKLFEKHLCTNYKLIGSIPIIISFIRRDDKWMPLQVQCRKHWNTYTVQCLVDFHKLLTTAPSPSSIYLIPWDGKCWKRRSRK